MKGEEEGDSDEMMLKGNEGAEGEETGEAGGKLKKKKKTQRKK